MERHRLLGAGHKSTGSCNGRPAQDSKYGGVHRAGDELAKRGILACQYASGSKKA